MKPADIIAVLIEIATAIPALVQIGIFVNLFVEELHWFTVDLNKIFHAHGRSNVLVQIIASVIGFVLAIAYQQISAKAVIAWREFVLSTWGILPYWEYTPYLIVVLSIVIYLYASIGLRDPIRRKLHIPESV